MAGPHAFLEAAERAVNERDLAAAVAPYDVAARLDNVTDGAREIYVGRESITRAWTGYLRAMAKCDFSLRKSLVTAAPELIVNRWEGAFGAAQGAEGLEIWHLRGDRVIAHELYGFFAVRHSRDLLARLRVALVRPRVAITFLREQRRAGATPSREGWA